MEISEEQSQPPGGSWQQEYAHRANRQQIIKKYGEKLLTHELEALQKPEIFTTAITPYYLNLINFDDPNDPIRKMVIPSIAECHINADEQDDPLGEDHDKQFGCVVHRYPDRVLFLATNNCASYCRYCTRSRLVGKNQPHNPQIWERGFRYIENTPQIRDVLISGGDPLTLEDDILEAIIKRIRAIKHVEIIRIGTKVPMVMPNRITPKLATMLSKYHPLFISIHAAHPREITPQSIQACNYLANAGIPLGSQTVLLRGVNDNPETIKQLMHKLLTCRVRPYYLYQCDLIRGSSHFRTTIQDGLNIMQALRGHTSGYAVPTYVIDAPGGGGKIPLLPNYVQGFNQDKIIMKNYEGNIYSYPTK
jgi:lysine 2,3-aminomutase